MTRIEQSDLHAPSPGTRATSDEQPPAQAPTVRTRKTSVLPGALRNLLDKATARSQTNAAKALTVPQLTVMLNRQDIHGGRNIRALQRRAHELDVLSAQQAPRGTGALDEPQRLTTAPISASEITELGEASVSASEITELSEAPITPPRAAPAPIAPLAEQAAAAATRPSAIAPPDGPVIDPDMGVLDKSRLRQTARALIDALPPLPDDLAVKHPTSDALRNRLIKELGALNTLAADNTRLAPHELGLAVRDTFAKASQTARVLARFLDRLHVAGHGPRPDAASYFLIAGLLTELKRTHLSAAAGDIGCQYAKREVANLERVAPGISRGISGPNVSTTNAIGLTYAPLHARSALELQAGASGGATFFSDDDRDIDFWTSYSVSLKAGIGGTLGKWTGRTSAQLSYSGGNVYFEHDDLRELVKLVANLDANRSWIRSASPKTRKLVDSMQQFRNNVAKFVGRNYTPAAGRPAYLNDSKIAKGFNAFKMQLLSTALDAHLGDDRFSKLISAAYPSVGDTLRQRMAQGAPLPAATRRDVPDSVAYADRPVAFREATAIVDANLGNGTRGGTSLEAAGSFDVNLKGDLMQFFTETASAPHQLLDPAYHKDYKATFELHRQLDVLCGSPPPPQLHLYDIMRRRLQGADTDAPVTPFSEQEQCLYGDAASVPTQFRHIIAQAGPQQLEHATAQAEHLTQTYRGFIDDSAALLARNDKYMHRSMSVDLHIARAAAFARINDRVWGGRYPHSERKVMANPEKFIADSHANISLALGCVGTHIALAKQQITARDDPRDAEAAAHAIKRTDTHYDTTRKLLDRLYLPLKKYDVQKNGPLKDAAVWERWDAALKLQASGGAESNLLNATLGRLKKSLGPVSITNDAGDIAASSEVKFLKATRQVNPSRLGTFWQITLNAQAGAPLLGNVLDQAVTRAVARLNRSLATDAPKIDAEQAIRQVQGFALNVSDGSSIVMKFRQAPGLGPRSTDLQYVRVLSNKSSGLGVSVTLPSHVGTLTPTLTSTDSTQGFEGEIMGPDLSYLMMQHPKLAELLARASSSDASELRQLFDANPHVRNGYFGNPQTIVEVVERYSDYLRAKANSAASGQPLENAPMVNEFQRYYASQPFARVARLARQVERHAPGSTANGAMLHEQSALSTDIPLGNLDLDAARRHLQTLSTIDQRADYFCGEGRPLLDAFAAIVGNTRAINSAALLHVDPRNSGIRTTLRDEAMLRKHNVKAR